MYRTGDMVQQNADGSLIYLGHRDTQIKIHGQRVEIGEIENHTTSLLPGSQKVVKHMVRPGSETEAHKGPLVLVPVTEFFLAGKNDSNNNSRGLRPYKSFQITGNARKASDMLDVRLGQVLPAYMVPTAFLIVSRIPMNGKPDHCAVQDASRLIPHATLTSFACSSDDEQAPNTAM
ncbi:hypothetical protein NX059_012253 [Plenodomus lindquistii]|nr:hypothetical protein NX059_012253 [Plenodomus lindquistii]